MARILQSIATSRVTHVTVIPAVVPNPSEAELDRLRLTEKNTPGQIVFLSPRGLDLSAYLGVVRRGRVLTLNESWFRSTSSYSQLMLQPSLYDRFSEFDFMVICQLDAFLIAPFPFSVMESIDWLGAPWLTSIRLRWNPFTRQLNPGRGFGLTRRLFVGNGGLSVRRVSKFRLATRLLPKLRKQINEDLVFSFFTPLLGIRTAPLELASQVLMETGARLWKVGDPAPAAIGFHALQKINPDLESHLLGTNL